MIRGALVSVVALLLCGGARCVGHGAPSNACYVGGALQVHSAPTGFPVTSGCCNLIYPKEDFQLQPNVRLLSALPGETYSLFMLDADAPGLPEGESFIQWLQANIPGENFRCGSLKNSTDIAPYVSPYPPPGTGVHRYMFFVYQHFPPTTKLPLNPIEFVRMPFNISDFVRETELEGLLLRGPIAGVQFRTAFTYPPDETVVEGVSTAVTSDPSSQGAVKPSES